MALSYTATLGAHNATPSQIVLGYIPETDLYPARGVGVGGGGGANTSRKPDKSQVRASKRVWPSRS